MNILQMKKIASFYAKNPVSDQNYPFFQQILTQKPGL